MANKKGINNVENRRDRKDKVQNMHKIAKLVIENPHMKVKDIARRVGLTLPTVISHLKALQVDIKDDRISAITDKDLEIVEHAQDLILGKLEKNELGVTDAIKAATLSTKRYTLFKGEITDSSGGMKPIVIDFSDKSLLELEQIRQQLLDNEK